MLTGAIQTLAARVQAQNNKFLAHDIKQFVQTASEVMAKDARPNISPKAKENITQLLHIMEQLPDAKTKDGQLAIKTLQSIARDAKVG